MWAGKWIGIVCSMIWGIETSGAGMAVPTPEASQIAPAPAVYEELKIARQDVTGDARADIITLLGKRFAPDSPYYEQLKLMVQDPVAKKVSFFQTTYGGYQPEMSFCDFVGNKTKQILVQAPTGGSAGTSDFYLFSDKDNNPAVLPVPQPLTISGSYQDGYKVPLTIKETNQTTVLDLSDRKDIYEENGVYKNGKLVQPVEVLPNTFSVLKPVEAADGTCELRGEQRVSGVANADTIAYVESLWKWVNDGWKLQSAQVKKAQR
ncbi:hypothetical protein [Brevibacillus choshinensis]|uniref:DUF3828 domain-containing protein n=1 Tax=Brevibacillus choshinensis TaxID=54911 RepID=A0ABX7FM12_BRECH|nr:hypothetical protein [Brevibacillus choshinensis]QRG66885.1 hypothetical protein JNE38_25965 [Brevibacillus choshinensis]